MQRLASVALLVSAALPLTAGYVLAPSGFVGKQLTTAAPEVSGRERSDAVVMKLFDHKRRAIRQEQKEWLATMAGIVERANLWEPESDEPEPEFDIPKKPRSIRTPGHDEFEKHSGGLFAQVSQPGAKKIHWRKGRGVGAGQGTSCGYGMRGQNSRGGVRPGFAGGQTPLYRTAPKWPGRPMGSSHYYTKYALIKLEHLNEVPDNVTEVDYSTLVDNGIVTATRTKMEGKRSRFTPFKVVGGSELTRKGLTVKAHAFTSSAVEAIEAAGGKCVLLSQTTDEVVELAQDA